MLKRNSIWLGIAIGILLPFILYALFFYSAVLLNIFNADQLNSYVILIELISIALNMIPMRYYFINLKCDKTGKGILLITFVLIILFFAIRI